MKHNKRCENAKPKSKCRCRCGGAKHGINNIRDDYEEFERTITERIGGELGRLIAELTGKDYTCQGCGLKQKIGSWLGYPHDGGIADKFGKCWWVYQECEKCNYHTSFGMIEHQVRKFKQTSVDDYLVGDENNG